MMFQPVFARKSKLNRVATNDAHVHHAPPIVNEVLRSPGQSLDAETRALMEPRFGHDFSRVLVHTDSRAAESAQAVNALAYTVGRDIVFDAGQYAPHTRAGQQLLAHELTHVAQQTGKSQFTLQRKPKDGKPDEGAEEIAAEFSSCDTDRESTIKDAIKQAKKLADRTITAFERDFPMSYESKAISDHFGNLSGAQQATVLQRYKHIRDNVENKTYTCVAKNKKVKAGKTKVDLCGEAPCPGSRINLFPIFGQAACPAGATILHEAAHNAGACDDIDTGKGYPPANAEDNAYSYERCALAIVAGYKTPDLGKKKSVTPPVKE